MRETLSAAGYQSARDVMRLNEHALEITGKPEEYGEWLYWVSVFGTPSPDEPWGWQIDGHHLNLNCFVLGDQLVLTPTFMGSEPVLARFGKYAGNPRLRRRGGAGLRADARSIARGTAAGDDRRRSAIRTADGRIQRQPADRPSRDSLRRAAARERDCLEALLATYTGRIRPGTPRSAGPRRSVTSARRVSRGSARSTTRARSIIASEPGDPDRVRSPIGHHVRQRQALARPYPHRGANAQRQRLRQGSAAPALRPARPLATGFGFC